MFTVYLADDEFTVLEGLKRLFDWKKAGFEVVGEAHDGDAAFEGIRKLKPDIVLTDIRMPGLNGLELIKSVKAEGLDCRFIIISGYDDFSYCLEALRLGVSDYILKPIDFSSIGEKLGKVAKTINGADKDEQSNISRIAEEARRFKLNRFFNAVFAGSPRQSEFVSDIDNQELPRQYFYCIYAAVSYNNTKLSPTIEKYAAAVDYLYHLMYKNMYVFVVGFNSRSKAKVEIGKFALDLKHDMEKQAPVGVAVGHGEMCRLDDIGSSYLQVVDAVEQEVFYQGFVDDIPMSSKPDISVENFIKAKINKIVEAVKLANPGEADNALNAFFDYISENRFPKARVEALLNEISVLVDNMFYQFKSENSNNSMKNNFLVPVFDFSSSNTLTDCRDMLRGVIQDSIKSISAIYENNKNPFMNIKKYVKEHYAEDLSLKSLAGIFHMNPSYLSRLFKEKYDVNYCEYLNMVRIEKGKGLLMSSSMSISEISEYVGFSDYRYFTKVFKKYEGMSPQKYKKNVHSNNQGMKVKN